MSSNAQRTSTTAKRPLEWMRFDPVKFMFLIEDLSLEEVGAVTKIMLKLWQFGPMSESDLRKASKAHFEVIKNLTFEVDDLLSFELVEDARDHGERRRNQRVEAGIASAAKRNDRSTTVQRTVNDRSTDVLSISKSSSLSKKEHATEIRDERFEALWKTYQGKGAKGKARDYWAKLNEEDRAAIIAKAPAYVASTMDDRLSFRKNLEGWINPAERRWEAPVITQIPATNGQRTQTQAERDAELDRITDQRYAGH